MKPTQPLGVPRRTASLHITSLHVAMRLLSLGALEDMLLATCYVLLCLLPHGALVELLLLLYA